MSLIRQSNGSANLPQQLGLVSTAIVLFMLTLGTTQGALAATGTDNPEGVTSGDIDELIQKRMDTHGIPGVSVAVIRNGDVIHLAGYGVADPDGRQVDPDTPFLIGSVSKPFTSLAVYQLISDGVLSLDQPIVPLLSDVVDEPAEGFENVTIEHLLSHTSGLSMADGLAGTMKIHIGPDALPLRVQEIMAAPLSGTPGEKYEYSNAGAVLLAGIVEQATGMAFADYLSARVIGPLGMERTFASDTHPAAADLATGHRQWFGRWMPAALPYDPAGVPNGYIGSTAGDLASFMQAHLDGEPADVMPLEVSEFFERPATPTGWEVPLEGAHNQGWFVDELGGEPVVSHAGSLGHFTAHLILAPEADQLGIAVLSNASAFVAAGHGGQYDLSLELARMLLGAESQPAEAGVLMTTIAPAVSWAGALAILFGAARFLRTGRHRIGNGDRGSRIWVRIVIPSLGYIGTGTAILMAAPLHAARHFYPDVGWGLTATAYLAIGWGTVRALVGYQSGRNRRQRHPETRASAEPAELAGAR